MRLTVVGCSGSGPGPDSPASCYLVEHDGFRLVLDLGNGSLGQLSRYVDPRAVDMVLLSHLHADHCLDACSLMVVHRHHPGPRPGPIPLAGPSGTTQRLLAAADPGWSSLSDVFSVTELTAGSRPLGPFQLRLARTNHPVETYAVRIEAGGRSLTYSADTGPCAALVELARGSDLLLCEASFQEPDPGRPTNPPDLHLTGRGAAEHATAAGVGGLLLTHIPLWYDPARTLAEATEVFDRSELVRSGSAYDV
ncbi:MAG: MBL fold metallo-hydrolase [Geodermatophilaceae bacterium]|nr:MBL fold metallo-hydrolase [Geodermatophilaceae bacterium]